MGNLKRLAALIFVSVLTGTAGAEAQLVLGGPSANGSLKVRTTTSADQLLLEVDPVSSAVRVGSLLDSGEVDFEVAGTTSVALRFDAHTTKLTLGDADNAFSGDLEIFESFGQKMFDFSGTNASLELGGVGEDGDLWIADGGGTDTFRVDGSFGDVEQTPSGEGLIKAWCRVGSDGTQLGGYNCSSTAYEGGGSFFSADFTALATDISDRGLLITVNEYGLDQSCAGSVNPNDLSRVLISCPNQVQFVVAIF